MMPVSRSEPEPQNATREHSVRALAREMVAHFSGMSPYEVMRTVKTFVSAFLHELVHAGILSPAQLIELAQVPLDLVLKMHTRGGEK